MDFPQIESRLIKLKKNMTQEEIFFLFLQFKKIYLLYWKGRVREREGETWSERSPIHCFTPHMAASAGTVLV